MSHPANALSVFRFEPPRSIQNFHRSAEVSDVAGILAFTACRHRSDLRMLQLHVEATVDSQAHGACIPASTTAARWIGHTTDRLAWMSALRTAPLVAAQSAAPPAIVSGWHAAMSMSLRQFCWARHNRTLPGGAPCSP